MQNLKSFSDTLRSAAIASGSAEQFVEREPLLRVVAPAKLAQPVVANVPDTVEEDAWECSDHRTATVSRS
jgi:hypothetical protein